MHLTRQCKDDSCRNQQPLLPLLLLDTTTRFKFRLQVSLLMSLVSSLKSSVYMIVGYGIRRAWLIFRKRIGIWKAQTSSTIKREGCDVQQVCKSRRNSIFLWLFWWWWWRGRGFYFLFLWTTSKRCLPYFLLLWLPASGEESMERASNFLITDKAFLCLKSESNSIQIPQFNRYNCLKKAKQLTWPFSKWQLKGWHFRHYWVIKHENHDDDQWQGYSHECKNIKSLCNSQLLKPWFLLTRMTEWVERIFFLLG